MLDNHEDVPPLENPSFSSEALTKPGFNEIERATTLRIALVCQSNVNRSMEAHDVMQKKGYSHVDSFGVGTKVRLPGEAPNRPNVYDFGTTYKHIYADLSRKNNQRYIKNGMLAMLDRDARVKQAPERWQSCLKHFDVVITFEKRVWEAVCADCEFRRENQSYQLVQHGISFVARSCHIINVETKDNHREALTGAILAEQLLEEIMLHRDWEDAIVRVIDNFEISHGKEMLHAVVYC